MKRAAGIRVGTFLTMAALFTGVIETGSTQATTVSKPGTDAKVAATVKPTRLPADRAAPVTLALDGRVTHSDRATCEASCAHVRTVELRLDRQIDVDTEGLPICQVGDVKGYPPSQARRKCGRALIGSGETAETTQFPEVAPFTVSTEQLFFNAGKGGKVLMYTYASQYGSGAGLVGTIRDLTLRPNDGNAAIEVSFHFTFGKTWRYKGKRHGYLNGRCASGSFKNMIRLELDSGPVSDIEAQRCTRTG